MCRIKLGVFGATFDPPTLGHLDVLQQAAGSHDSILLVPNAWHAFGKKPLSLIIRLKMLEYFIDEAYVDCPLEICDLEAKLLKKNDGHPVYTFDLLEALTVEYRYSAQLSFIRGPDNAIPEVWQKFYKFHEIESRWPIFTATERIPIRSSHVRKILESANTVDGLQKGLDMLLPSTQTFILNHNLYHTEHL